MSWSHDMSKLYLISSKSRVHSKWELNLEEFVRLLPFYLHVKLTMQSRDSLNFIPSTETVCMVYQLLTVLFAQHGSFQRFSGLTV